MNVAVIIVNYGTPDLASNAVESVLARTHGGHTVEVHLVDNASPGDDVAQFRKRAAENNWGDRVTLWDESENHGFGRGNNVVLRALSGRETPPDYVFLLNPDAELTNEAIPILIDAMEADPRIATAGAGICNMQAEPMSAAFRFPSMASEFLRTANFGPLDRLFSSNRASLPPDYPQGPVDWVAAAAVMFRLEALHEVGYFDPGFFLYYEEVELMYRLNQHGWKTIYVPKAQARHVEGAATGGGGMRRDRPSYIYESWRHYFLTTKGRGAAIAIALLVLPAAFLNVAQLRLRGRTPTIPAKFLSNHWRLVLRPLLLGRAGG